MNTTGKVLLGVGAVAGVAIVVGLRRAHAAAQKAEDATPGPAATPGVPGTPVSAPQAVQDAVAAATGVLGKAKPMTDALDPAPPDVNNAAPPGSAIVPASGAKTKDGASAETNRILNLQKRWGRLEQAGFGPGAPGMTDDMMIKYAGWKGFFVGRFQRTMEGWENQFRNLIAVEDAWQKSHPSFIIDRRDVTAGT